MHDLAQGLTFYLVFLFSVTLHEAAHAWTALRGGDPTAYVGGQVSLHPGPHIRRQPFGMVVLPLITVLLSGWPIGFASAPYDPAWAHRYPRRAGWMALAGPVSNLALVLAAMILIRGGIASGFLVQPNAVSIASVVVSSGSESGAAVAALLSAVFSLNLVLFLLNMVPVPPLDGSAALVLLLPERRIAAYQEFVRQPMLGWLGILVAWRLLDKVFYPLFTTSVNLLYPGSHYG